MKRIKIISWNVNGIRASVKKGLWSFVDKDKAEIYCFQETRAFAEQVEGAPTNYFSYWNSADKAGYSGTATFSKLEPKIIINDPENEDFYDDEGRIVVTKFDEFTLLNVYFPNGKKDKVRLDFKLRFYKHFLTYINKLRDRGEKIIFCGDVNTAHQEIDLARPKANKNISGFLEIERDWISKVEKSGYIDTYRVMYPEKETYSWWSQMGGARTRNVGWRIDYVFVDESLKDKIKDAFILTDVMGSDHCPVGIEIEI